VLRICRDNGIRAIVNHRPQRDSPTGHYTLLVDIDDKNVVLHDPSSGPSRTIPHDEFLELWQPRFPNSEIAGYVLVAIGRAGLPAAPPCEFCHTGMPARVECPQCTQPVSLRPGIPLGCVNTACLARLWNYLCCPSCDFTWTFTLYPGAPVGVRTPEASADGKTAQAADPVSLAAAFAELDKFTAHVLAIPGMADNPELKKHLDSITTGKEKLTLARAEGLSHLNAHNASMAAMMRETEQRGEAHRQKMEAAEQPAVHLDGDALGAALLKNLGFR
jgi:hypothetical protein